MHRIYVLGQRNVSCQQLLSLLTVMVILKRIVLFGWAANKKTHYSRWLHVINSYGSICCHWGINPSSAHLCPIYLCYVRQSLVRLMRCLHLRLLTGIQPIVMWLSHAQRRKAHTIALCVRFPCIGIYKGQKYSNKGTAVQTMSTDRKSTRLNSSHVA